MITRTRVRWWNGAVLLLVLVAAPAEAAPPPAGDPILGGPAVEADPLRDEIQGMRRFLSDQRRPTTTPAEFMRTVNELELRPEQRTAVSRIVAEMRTAQRRYRRDFGAETASLRRQVRQARAQERDVAPEVRLRLREIEARAPKPETFQAKVWELLDADQRSLVIARLAGVEGAADDGGDAMGARLAAPYDDLGPAAIRRLRFLVEHQRPGP